MPPGLKDRPVGSGSRHRTAPPQGSRAGWWPLGRRVARPAAVDPPSDEQRRRPLLSLSPDDPRRSRLLPRGALLGLGGVCLVVLAIVFPGEGLVRLIERTGNHALAIDYLQNLLRLHPGDARLLTLLAERYLAIGEVRRAWQVLQQVAGPQAEALRERVAVASWRAARDAGQTQEAAYWHAIVLERALSRRPASAAEWIGTLELLHELGAFDRSGALLAEADARGRSAPLQAEDLARRLLALAQPRAAAQLLTAAAQASDGLRQRALWRAAAAAWLSAGDAVQAYRVAAGGLGAPAPVDTADAWLLARLAVAAGQPVDAAQWLRRALGMDATGTLEGSARLDTRGLDEAWRVFAAAGDLDAALQVSALARRLDAASTVWAERHARVLEWAGRPREALPLWVQLMRGPLAREAQGRVQALAPGLLEWDAMIAYWRTRAAAGAMPFADWTAYITLLRQQGRTAEAIEVARRAVRQHPGLLRVLAQLLWAEAQVDEALATYEEAARKGLLDAAARLEGAGAMLAAVRLEDAARLLAPDPEAGTPAEVRETYLELRADLAWELGDDRRAWRDYAALYALKGEGEDAMAEFRAQRLLALTRRLQGNSAALRLAPSLWSHRASAGLAELWLDVIAQQPSTSSLLEWERAMAASPVGAQLQRRPAVVQRQAALWRGLGHMEAALRLLRRARALAPQNVPILIDWVSLLLERQMLEELHATLAREAGRLERDPEGALVLAEAARELGQTAWAAKLMRAQYARREHDPLWLASYADLLEQVGQRGPAQRARQRAWDLLVRASAAPAGARPRAGQELARLLLQLRLAPGRATEAEQRALVRDLRERLREGGLEPASETLADAAIVNWLLALDFDSWADWWLARRAVAGSIGAGQRLLRALARGERETVREQWREGSASLTAEDRAEALWLVGERETSLAESARIVERSAAREDDPDRLRAFASLHTERQRERTHRAELGLQDERLGGLDLRRTGATVHLALGERLGLTAHGLRERLARRGGSTLAPLPSGQTLAGVALTWQAGERARLSAGMQRHGVGEQTSAVQVEGRYQLTDAYRLGLSAAYDAAAGDTDLLRLAARRDRLALQWEGVHGRLYGTATATAARYRTDRGSRLGRTTELRAEAGYWLRRAEPVLTVRGFASWRDEHADDIPRPELGRWVASGEALSGAQVLPASQAEFGLGVRWGLADGLPSRRWWPQVEVTLARSSRTGFTPAASIAWRGPVAGDDELEFSVQRSQSDTGPGQQVRLQYRRWFGR